MSIQIVRRLISVSEYHRMAEANILTARDRVELIQGEIIHTSPIGSKHSAYVNRLNTLLNQKLGGRAIISVQNPVQLNDFSEPEPDIAILRLQDDFYIHQHPKAKDIFLVIEIADSSLAYDQEIKLPNYALAEIPECWIVDLEHSHIEVYQSPKHGRYTLRKIIYQEDRLRLEAFELEIAAVDVLM